MNQRCTNREDQKRFVGDVIRSPTTKSASGLPTGPDTVIASNVMFAMRPLRGREIELARQQFAGASVRVTLHLDRAWGLTPADKIIYRGGPLDGQILNIGHIADDGTLGLDTVLTCSEGDLS